MSFTGTVENGVIKLPPGVDLPEGTEVSVELCHPASAAGGQAETETAPSRSTLAERMAEFIGCIDGPPDLAENHDHYAHGAPKGIDRL